MLCPFHIACSLALMQRYLYSCGYENQLGLFFSQAVVGLCSITEFPANRSPLNSGELEHPYRMPITPPLIFYRATIPMGWNSVPLFDALVCWLVGC